MESKGHRKEGEGRNITRENHGTIFKFTVKTIPSHILLNTIGNDICFSKKTDGGRREKLKCKTANENATANIVGPSDMFTYQVLGSKRVSSL